MRLLAQSFAELLGDAAITEERRSKILSSMPAGTTLKKTSPHRLSDIDAEILSAAKAALPAAFTVHDMAASDGVTSLDLFDLLSQEIPEARVRSSDYYDAMWVARRGPFRVFYDKDLHPLQVSLGRIALRSRSANRFLAVLLAPHRAGMKRVSLVHPAVAAKADVDDRFTVAVDNFFSPVPAVYGVVRVMNALAESNFQRPEIERAVRAIAPTVADGGLLVLGRSVDELDGRSEATIFRRDCNRFLVFRDLANGYHLREFVLSLDISAS